MAFFFPGDAELTPELAVQSEHLDAVVVGVGDGDLFVFAQTETVRGIELALAGAQRAETGSKKRR